MTDFRKLAEKLADRLNDANAFLAYLNEKNIIDDEESIMKTWEILADARNEIQEPEPEMKELTFWELEEIFDSHSVMGIGGTNCKLMGSMLFKDAYKEIMRRSKE